MNRAQGRVAQHDNREGPADGSLCAGVKGPPRRGPLVPRLHAAAANQRAWSPPAAANLQTRGPGMNRKGIRLRGAWGRRLPGPLQASGLFPTTARSAERLTRASGLRRSPRATQIAARAVGSRDSAAAPAPATLPASGHGRRERGAQIGPNPKPGAAAGQLAAPRESYSNFAGGEGPGVAPTPPAPARPGRQSARTPWG